MSATTLARIAEALSRPLLMHPSKAEIILSVLDGRLGSLSETPAADLETLTPDASRFVGRTSQGRSYRSQDGVAFIPIVGSLANRGAWIGASSGITSYEGIGAQLRQAASDPEIHSIVLDLDSPGGEATGMFRISALLREVRKSKRVVAYVDDMAASAAYGIASSASEIVISPTSIVGSIGVVLTHIDRSGELEKQGRRVTLIHAGANKVDGHPYGPLSAQVKADLQSEVLAFYEQFVATVVAGRPGLTPGAVKATEARTYLGQEAIDRGLADRIATIDEVVSGLTKRNASTSRGQQGALTMSGNKPAVDADRFSEGFGAGTRSAHDRIRQVLDDPRAKGHELDAIRAALAEPYKPAAGIVDQVLAARANRTSGLRTAIDASLGGKRESSSLSGQARSGLSAAVDEFVENERTPSSSQPRSGLSTAVDAMVERGR